MDRKEKEEFISILKEAGKAIQNEDILTLKELSNKTIHIASFNQDTDGILLAVIIYSLGKIIQKKKKIGVKACEGLCEVAIKEIEKSVSFLEKGNRDMFVKSLEKIKNYANKLSEDFKRDVQDVLRKAQINKASQIHEHGISLEKTAQLLGVTMWELAQYTGQKRKDDRFIKTIDVKTRIKNAMAMFE